MRYFLRLSYLGAPFSGWQRQPNAVTVQETLETALSTILRENIGLTGCGRTDTGVHARYYVAHFDASTDLPATFLQGLNSLLPDSIAVHRVVPVAPEAHARFDALERSYEYHIALEKDPFAIETTWFFPQNRLLDREKMERVTMLLPRFGAFYPFCKSHSGVDSYACSIKNASWALDPEASRLVFRITANRFLRGMVRLIVGASIQAGMGQISPESVENALEKQINLPKSLSVPPQGLSLTYVLYPEAIGVNYAV